MIQFPDRQRLKKIGKAADTANQLARQLENLGKYRLAKETKKTAATLNAEWALITREWITSLGEE
ncbi:MAG: hypothetical protein PUK59_04685 [Actinomycetaceae bacterium]|nr:hypothetical protein [Actinomycetaceae bacterium]MDY5273629.1 hypothetical protein [Arcanobacterium sp.]